MQRPSTRNDVAMCLAYSRNSKEAREPPVLKSCKKSRCLERSTSRKKSDEGRQAGVVEASGFYAKCSKKPLEDWQPVTVRGL